MNSTKKKRRLALFGMGILGGGTLGQGIPVLTDLFARLSSHFEIVFYCYNSIDAAQVPPDIKVRQIVSFRLPGRVKYLILAFTFALDHLLKPYDLLFAVSIYPTGRWAVWLGRIFHRPVLVQLIALEAVALRDIGYGNLTIPWLRKITRQVCEETDALVTVADYQKEVARHSLPTMREIAVLPLRIDCEKFPFRERRISFPIQFIHIAYYSPIKDQDTMFVAFANVSNTIDCHLTVIGDGFSIPKVKAMLQQLKITDKVTFTGAITQSEVHRYLDQAHILLHPARFETGCAVIQEAMASGVAVCGTNVGILADIGDRYAAIFPVGDVKQMTEKMLQLIHDPRFYQQVSDEAYQWITTYDALWAFENYLSFLDKMVTRIK